MTRRMRSRPAGSSGAEAGSACCDIASASGGESSATADSGAARRLAGGRQFKHRVAFGDRDELGFGGAALDREIALHRRSEAIEIGLEQGGPLRGGDLANDEIFAPSAFAQCYASGGAGVAHPVGFAPRCDQVAAPAGFEQIDRSGVWPAAFAP